MIKSNGLFGMFDNLDQIDPEDLIFWLKPVPDLIVLENYLANRILYPQTLPVNSAEVQFDLAILREALKNYFFSSKDNQQNTLLEDNLFYNFTLRKILIPKKFLLCTSNLHDLVKVFADVLLMSIEKKDWFEDFWTVILTDELDEIVGSLLIPQFEKNGNVIQIKVLNKGFSVSKGELKIIPCASQRCEITYEIDKGTLLDKQSNSVEVSGGRLGIIVDGRRS